MPRTKSFPAQWAILIPLFGAVALLLPSSARAQSTTTVVLQPNTRNQSIQSTCSGAAYGDRLQLVDSATNCYSFDALLDFDLTPLNGIPASNIVSARLELYVTFAANTLGGPWRDFPAGAYPNRAAWNLSTNWFTAPPFDASAAYENRITLTNQTGVFRSWNVTQAVKDWAGGTQPNYGLRLVALDNGQFGDFYNIFAPAGHADPLLRPRLVVQYVTAPPACLPPPSNLVSWWRAESNAQDSKDSNHGTLVNGAAFGAGKVGQAFALDGFDDYVSANDAANLDGMAQLTVETWVKFNAVTPGKWQFVVAKGSASGVGTNSYVIWLAGDTLKIQAAIESTTMLTTLVAPDVINPSQFYHVAITYDGATFRLYLDGVLKTSTPFSGPIRNTAFPLLFGRRSGVGVDGRGDTVIGAIDEPAVYNRALTATEVLAIYNADGAGKCQPDSTPPEITPTVTGTVGSNGWYTSDVTVSWDVQDPESAITSTSGCETTEVLADTAGTTLTCTASSAGGTASQAVTIMRDATPPTIQAITTPGPAPSGWYNIATGAPTISFHCSDDMSGLDGACPAAVTLGDGENQSVTRGISDLAGNPASVTVSDLDVDLTAPGINITTPASGGAFLLNAAVASSYSCSDGLSGLASCIGPVANGASIDTASVGSKNFTVNASDVAGNPASLTHAYDVTYSICLLYDPTKSKKSGSTFPIKIQACDSSGANRSSSSIVVTATSVVRVSDNAPAPLEDSGNANPEMNFRFDASLGGTGGYIFNLSLNGFPTGTYWLFFTVAGDPVTHRVEFQVK